jgi:SAM-dependent methyltransferase
MTDELVNARLLQLAQFTVPLNASVAVAVPDDEEAPQIPTARTRALPVSKHDDRTEAFLGRLEALRSEDCELLIVPAPLLGWLDSLDGLRRELERTYVPVATDDGAGAIFSLYPRAVNGEARSAPDGLPLPPVHLVRVTSGCARQARRSLDTLYRNFYRAGASSAASIEETLRRNGVDVEKLEAVLDFGCGCGRVLRHWRKLAGTSLFACDYNPFLVEWCERALPFAEFAVNRLEPSLPYEDEQFDLVYAMSIFTHLSEELEAPWLAELMRVVKRGGLLLFTVHGDERAREGLKPADYERFSRGEAVVVRSELAGSNACAVYHPERYVRERLVAGLELLDHVPSGAVGEQRQDIVLVRKPPR